MYSFRRAGFLLSAFLVVLMPAGQLLAQEDDPQMIPAPDRSEGEGPFDRLVIRGATVIDGSGAPPIGPVDIVIEGNRITRIESVGYPGVPIDEEGRIPFALQGLPS